MSQQRAAELLGPRGPFAARLPGYEAREGQVRVASAVEALLRDEGVLLAEAGTGIGKTFAYLVPSVLSGRTVVISTATKNLQDQIAERDLPLVQEVLGTRVQAARMKGLSNYLCRRRYKQFLLSPEGMRPGYAQELESIRTWLRGTESGDLSELRHLPEGARIRHEISSSSDTRLGTRCPEYERCFVTEMRREADQAQIVIVNHHLFFADLALRGPHPGRVLPEYDAVIFDEAHQIEDTASLFFGAKLSEGMLLRLLTEAARTLALGSRFGGSLDPEVRLPLIDRGRELVHRYFDELCADGRDPLQATRTFEPKEGLTIGKQSYLDLSQALTDLAHILEGRAASVRDMELREVMEQLGRRFTQAAETLTAILGGQAGAVTWFDRTTRTLSMTPVDLSHILRDRLWDTVPAVGLLSATLSSGAPTSLEKKSRFQYVRGRLGVPRSDAVAEVLAESPFDYTNNCLLYVPKDLPPAGAPNFVEVATTRITELVSFTGGGAFVLTTSLQSVERFAEQLAHRKLPFPLFIQGQRPKDALISAFRAAHDGVLVGTSSFWEGVDVPGSALRLVIIEKLPFSVPTEPVFEARARAIEARGGSSFGELALPDAAIRLKQGVGRLLRTSHDRGVIAVLDDRLTTKPYGKRLLRALPAMPCTADLQEVERVIGAFEMRGGSLRT